MASTPAATARPPILFATLLLAAVTALTFGPGLDGPFVGVEARAAIRDNPQLTSPWPPLASLASHAANLTFRPSLSASFTLNQEICGPTPRCFLAGNLLLHVAAGMLLLVVLQAWLSLARWPASVRQRALPLALAIAGLWSLHPLQTEVVTYLPGRAEGLAGTLLLAALCAGSYAGTAYRRLATLVAIATALLAAGSDTSAALALPLAVALDMHRQGNSASTTLRRRPILYLGLATAAVVALVLAGLRSNLGGAPIMETSLETWATQPAALLRHVVQFLWPATLGLEVGAGEPPPWWHAAAALPLIGAVGLLVFGRRQTASSPATIAATLVVLGWLPYALLPGPIAIAERQGYLTRVGLAALMICVATQLYARLARTTLRRGAVLTWAIAIGLFLVLRTQARIVDYRDEVGAFAPAARAAAEAQHLAYLRAQPTAAIREWQELRATGTKPSSGMLSVLRDTYLQLARQHVDAGDEVAAIPQLQRALELAPERADVHYDLGRILSHGIDVTRAEAHLQAAVALMPEHADAHLCLGELLARRDDLVTAREHFAVVRELAVGALEAEPDSAEGWCRLGRARRGLEQPERALEAFAQALTADPRHAESLRGRLATLLDLGRTDEAQQALAAAQRLLPHDPELLRLAPPQGEVQ